MLAVDGLAVVVDGVGSVVVGAVVIGVVVVGVTVVGSTVVGAVVTDGVTIVGAGDVVWPVVAEVLFVVVSDGCVGTRWQPLKRTASIITMNRISGNNRSSVFIGVTSLVAIRQSIAADRKSVV